MLDTLECLDWGIKVMSPFFYYQKSKKYCVYVNIAQLICCLSKIFCSASTIPVPISFFPVINFSFG